MSMICEMTFISSLVSTIPSVQNRLCMSIPLSYASGVGVPSTIEYPTPLYLWSMSLFPPLPSLAQSTIEKHVITSQLLMSDVQYGISPNPMVMYSMGYHFRWNWNSGLV